MIEGIQYIFPIWGPSWDPLMGNFMIEGIQYIFPIWGPSWDPLMGNWAAASFNFDLIVVSLEGPIPSFNKGGGMAPTNSCARKGQRYPLPLCGSLVKGGTVLLQSEYNQNLCCSGRRIPGQDNPLIIPAQVLP